MDWVIRGGKMKSMNFQQGVKSVVIIFILSMFLFGLGCSGGDDESAGPAAGTDCYDIEDANIAAQYPQFSIQGTIDDGTDNSPLSNAECRLTNLDGATVTDCKNNPITAVANQQGVYRFEHVPLDDEDIDELFVVATVSGLDNLMLSAYVDVTNASHGATISGQDVSPPSTVVAKIIRDAIETASTVSPSYLKTERMNAIAADTDDAIALLAEAATALFNEMRINNINTAFSSLNIDANMDGALEDLFQDGDLDKDALKSIQAIVATEIQALENQRGISVEDAALWGKVHGIVTDGSGIPISGADVNISHSQQICCDEDCQSACTNLCDQKYRTLTTDGNGEFCVLALSGQMMLATPENESGSVAVNVIPTMTTEVVLGGSPSATTGSIVGNVSDTVGPYEGVKVYVNKNDVQTGASAVTDGNGNFVISNAPEGVVYVYAEGFKDYGVTVTVVKGVAVNAVILLPSNWGYVRGRVVDGSDNPLYGIKVIAKKSTAVLDSAVTDIDGYYELEKMPEGYVYIYPDNYESMAILVSVKIGQTTTPMDFVLPITTRSIRGKVVDESGNPIMGITVTAKLGSETVGTAATNAEGYYRILNIMEGELVVSVQGYENKSVTVTVPSAGVANAPDIVLPTKGSVQGKVVDEDGDPVTGVRVEAKQNGAVVGWSQTNYDGLYTILSIEPGMTTLYVQGYESLSVSVYVETEGMMTASQIVLPKNGQISGQVVDANDNPQSGIEVGVIQNGVQLSQTAVTNAGGNYTLTGIPEGSATVFAVSYDANQVSVYVTAGTSVTASDIVLSLNGVVFGNVKGALDKLLKNIYIVAFQYYTDTSTQELKEHQLGQTLTDSFGDYRIENLPPGTIYVKALYDDFSAVEVEIEPDVEEAQADLYVEYGSITGRVLDIDSQPVPDIQINVGEQFFVIGSDVTDADGRYTVYNIPAGPPVYVQALGNKTNMVSTAVNPGEQMIINLTWIDEIVDTGDGEEDEDR